LQQNNDTANHSKLLKKVRIMIKCSTVIRDSPLRKPNTRIEILRVFFWYNSKPEEEEFHTPYSSKFTSITTQLLVLIRFVTDPISD